MKKYPKNNVSKVKLSLKTSFYKYKRPLIAVITISIFIGSIYTPIFFFSQSYNSYLQTTLTSIYQQTSNLNVRDYPSGWQTGSGMVTVIEKVGSNYYSYEEPWEYRYIGGHIETRVNHTCEHSAEYLLFPTRAPTAEDLLWDFESVNQWNPYSIPRLK